MMLLHGRKVLSVIAVMLLLAGHTLAEANTWTFTLTALEGGNGSNPFVTSIGANTGQLNATVHQGAQLGAGRIEGGGAKALAFDGVGKSDDDGQHVSINDGMTFGGGALSLCAWAKWDAFGSWSRIFDIGNGPDSDNIYLANSGTTNTLAWRVMHGATQKAIDVGNILQLDTWTHVCGTVEAPTGHMHVYIDGVEQQCTGGNACVKGEGTNGWTPNRMLRTNAYIGRSNWDNEQYFNGLISDVNIIDGKAVSADEVVEMMLTTTTPATMHCSAVDDVQYCAQPVGYVPRSCSSSSSSWDSRCNVHRVAFAGHFPDDDAGVNNCLQLCLLDEKVVAFVLVPSNAPLCFCYTPDFATPALYQEYNHAVLTVTGAGFKGLNGDYAKNYVTGSLHKINVDGSKHEHMGGGVYINICAQGEGWCFVADCCSDGNTFTYYISSHAGSNGLPPATGWTVYTNADGLVRGVAPAPTVSVAQFGMVMKLNGGKGVTHWDKAPGANNANIKGFMITARNAGCSPMVLPAPTTCVGNGFPLVISDPAARLNEAFWTKKCKLVPQDAVYMKVTMGSVVDYFKPLPGVGAGSSSSSSSKWCEMLVSNNKHMWSADGLSWRIPKYWGSSMGLGGSVEFWPKDNVIGDGRRHLSFWGHKDDSCGACSAGCCSNALDVPGSATTWIPYTLSVEFSIPAVTSSNTTSTSTTITTTTATAAPLAPPSKSNTSTHFPVNSSIEQEWKSKEGGGGTAAAVAISLLVLASAVGGYVWHGRRSKQQQQQARDAVMGGGEVIEMIENPLRRETGDNARAGAGAGAGADAGGADTHEQPAKGGADYEYGSVLQGGSTVEYAKYAETNADYLEPVAMGAGAGAGGAAAASPTASASAGVGSQIYAPPAGLPPAQESPDYYSSVAAAPGTVAEYAAPNKLGGSAVYSGAEAGDVATAYEDTEIVVAEPQGGGSGSIAVVYDAYDMPTADAANANPTVVYAQYASLNEGGSAVYAGPGSDGSAAAYTTITNASGMYATSGDVGMDNGAALYANDAYGNVPGSSTNNA